MGMSTWYLGHGSSVHGHHHHHGRKKPSESPLRYPACPLGSPLLGIMSSQSRLALLGKNSYFSSYCYLLQIQLSLGPELAEMQPLLCFIHTWAPFLTSYWIVQFPGSYRVWPPWVPQSVLEGYFWILGFTSILFGEKKCMILFEIVTCFELKISERAWSS